MVGSHSTCNELERLGDVASELVRVWDLDVGHDGVVEAMKLKTSNRMLGEAQMAVQSL
jgi:hypothetical protein